VYNAAASRAVACTSNLSLFYLAAHAHEHLVQTPHQKNTSSLLFRCKHRGSKKLVQVAKKNMGI
jgi:hypothetical protein